MPGRNGHGNNGHVQTGERPDSQPVAAAVVGHCSVRLWSVASDERLRRQLRGVGVTRVLATGELAGYRGSVVLLRADYLFDERTIKDLAAARAVLVQAGPHDAAVIAAHVPGERAEAVARQMLAGAPVVDLPGMQVHTPETLSPPYVGKLLKSAQPAALRIAPERQADLERYLFDGSYKGVTDLVTKWLWPHPARLVTKRCAEMGVRPNSVTAVSLLLAVVAGLLFASGWYGAGLAAGWLMTFLDTVDGKLARVTVDASKFGHLFDHGIDIIHPPLWYWAWGYGLTSYAPSLTGFPLEPVIQTILVAYVFGRLVEGAFDFFLAKFSIFVWQPADSYFRLIMSRRNPCLLLLTGSLLLGRPDAGLMAVAAWTVASCAFLLVRLAQAIRVRVGGGALHPWLAGMHADDPTLPWLARPFAPHSAARRRLG